MKLYRIWPNMSYPSGKSVDLPHPDIFYRREDAVQAWNRELDEYNDYKKYYHYELKGYIEAGEVSWSNTKEPID